MDIAVTEARKVLADLINRVVYGGEEVLLTRHGRPVAALVSPEDLELLRLVKSGRVDLTGVGEQHPAEHGAERPHHASPMRIAAELRPPGQPSGQPGPLRPPGFTR
ncbi:type II toxin-antitoxin system Phd/YefM family antitoxin [Actinomadura kijaniata]|uniref:Antitoxin n=1 Tax=Actinomadura namibiensis TaxID=182080 RepID=A0A7W3LSJ2_ACTNM|nr:type II toxin-antitoxin system Phd/YefM family antitoxin [Actinomadura namibiensis]MBA8953417.1 prevent-host-death family protein [Actinomadura namibiensis]